MPDAEYSYREMNEDLKGKDVTIELKDGRDISAKEVKISDDSVSWVDASSDRTFGIVTTDVKTVVDNKHWVGALEGMGFGMLVGGAVGIILNFSTESQAAGLYDWTVVAGSVGVAGVLGAGVGALIGHTDEYIFQSKINSPQKGK
jgi:hypothetical protein